MAITPADPPGPDRVLKRIGIWGAPTSGKTTFLAALHIAVARSPQDLLIFGVDDESTDFLVQNTTTLTKHRRFPAATKSLQPLAWTLNLQVDRTVQGRFRRQTQVKVPLSLNIDLLESPGALFSSAPEAEPFSAGGGAYLGLDDEDGDEVIASPAADDEELIEHLAGCDGIVLLIDPTREWDTGDTYHYFQGTLLRMAQHRLGGGLPGEMRLPQHLAVCITKFDDPTVYRRARLRAYRTFAQNDRYMFPRVADDDARRFFLEICHTNDRSDADLIAGTLFKYFWPARIRYFVTSAIGFYVNSKSSRFQEHDFQNVVPQQDGELRIRGQIHPINVLEPLLWLGQSVAGAE